jgi:hypothetical protein
VPAEVCRGILSTLGLYGLFVSAVGVEIRTWVQRDIGQTERPAIEPNFLIAMTP